MAPSGTEAIEAALKMARQYFLELPNPEPSRTRFIARRQSYHGNTLGSLSLGGHVGRRAPYAPILTTNVSHVSPCYSYRGKRAEESDEDYVARLAQELEDEFQAVGPSNVCAFVAETVSGTVSFYLDILFDYLTHTLTDIGLCPSRRGISSGDEGGL